MIVDHLTVGDIFHADCPNGAHLICLATSVTETVIIARSVTNDQYMEFDRKTGAGIVTWRERKTRSARYISPRRFLTISTTSSWKWIERLAWRKRPKIGRHRINRSLG
jgi:hypothetical protein